VVSLQLAFSAFFLLMSIFDTNDNNIYRVGMIEDLSGLRVSSQDTAGWKVDETPPATLSNLLRVVGRYYIPYMLANAKAWDGRAKEVRFTDYEGREWASTPFKYQQKCVTWLREDYAALSTHERSLFDSMIRGTGCEKLFLAEAKL
jgi:hypothetical protein